MCSTVFIVLFLRVVCLISSEQHRWMGIIGVVVLGCLPELLVSLLAAKREANCCLGLAIIGWNDGGNWKWVTARFQRDLDESCALVKRLMKWKKEPSKGRNVSIGRRKRSENNSNHSIIAVSG